MSAKLPLLALALIAAGATAADTRNKGSDLDRALAGRTAGTPSTCIDPSFADGPQIIDGQTILYRSGARVWRNTLDAPCPSLEPNAILIIERHGSQLCQNDLFRVTEPGAVIPWPIFRFGKFVPYDKPKK